MCAYPGMENSPADKIVMTGNPVRLFSSAPYRSKKIKARFDSDKPLVFMSGGSSAHAPNRTAVTGYGRRSRSPSTV